MRKDTRTFLGTVLGIPFTLSLAWMLHAASSTTATAVEDKPAPVITEIVPAPVPESKPEPIPAPAIAKKPVPVPASVPVATATPTPVETPVVVPAPVKKSRHTRSS
jgi:hypothetical protein